MPDQITSVEGMTPEAIVQAKKEGRLDTMLGIALAPESVYRMREGGTVTPEEAKEASIQGYYNEVAAAQRSGRVDWGTAELIGERANE